MNTMVNFIIFRSKIIIIKGCVSVTVQCTLLLLAIFLLINFFNLEFEWLIRSSELNIINTIQ